MLVKTRKNRLVPSLLCAFSVAFPYCFAGTLDIWVGNSSEFKFAPADFAGWAALAMLAVMLLVSAVLLLVPERVYPIILGLAAWFGIMSCVQGLFLNYGMQSLLGDDGGQQASPVWFSVLDTVLWIAAGIGCVLGALKMRKAETVRITAVILLVTVCGMQLVGCASLIPQLIAGETETETADTETQSDGTESETDDALKKLVYLTGEGMNTVAPGKNTVIFVLDRFDIGNYNDLLESDPDVFSFLTGFTAYTDNISLYSRTYPAVASMITGVRNDFTGSAEQYFADAYGQSEFLRALRENDYAVRIYTAEYYGYRDASVLAGTASNLGSADGYAVTDRASLVKYMLELSAYRYLPTLLKPMIRISTASFSGLVTYDDVPVYEPDDASVFKTVSGGLTVDGSGGQNAYTFIHLNGCHPPYRMDENGNAAESNATRAALGCFKLIRMYLDEMRRLGVYDDATVVITGDHPWAVNDHVEPTQPRQTALFVKEAGAADTPLTVSTAQVSQENLIPTLVKSAGLNTDRTWGTAYSEVPEGVNTERHHIFELTDENGDSALVDFRVCGPGNDFANWSVCSCTDIGWLYR